MNFVKYFFESRWVYSFVVEFRYYSILYTDYTNVNIYVRCGELSFATNMCDHPVLAVQTRQLPSLFTTDQQQYIDEKIDPVLAPYCLSSENLKNANYNASLRFCAPPEPDAFVQLIQLLAKYF